MSLPEIKTSKYLVKPSDSSDWVILRSPKGTEIDVELKILDYHYDCYPKKVKVGDESIYCSRLCCYAGCYVSQKEIDFIEENMKGIFPLLQPDAQKVLKDNDMQIYLPDDFDKEEGLYKTRCAPEEWDYDEDSSGETDQEDDQDEVPANHCIFLMDNGLCASHKYFVDNDINWVQEKFNICTTFPIDIRPQDKTIAFMDEFETFTFSQVHYLSKDEKKKKRMKMPQIVDSMKYVIAGRYGEEWWDALAAFAGDYRNGKVDIDSLYVEID
jgi:hypothetical protein